MTYLPHIEVDPQTYEVRADGQLLTCEPAQVLPLAQRYFCSDERSRSLNGPLLLTVTERLRERQGADARCCCRLSCAAAAAFVLD